MFNQALRARPVSASVAVLALASAVGGCSSDRPYSGERILADLKAAHVPSLEDVAATSRPASEIDLPQAGPISLADLMRVAEARNPRIAEALSEVGVAAGQAWQASLYPNPTVFTEVEDISWRDGVDGAKAVVGVSQPIILGDRRQAAIRAANAEQAARMAEVDVQRRTLFGEIAERHARLVSIREQERAYRELLELAGRTVDAASTRFEAKAAPETDVIKPRVERFRIEAALARLVQESAAGSAELALLIGVPAIDASRLEGSLPIQVDTLDLQTLSSIVTSSHPSLIAADRAIDSAAARVEQVKAEKTPDLDLSVAAGYRGENDDGIVQFGAGIEIPLWDEKQGDALSARFSLMKARKRRLADETDLLRSLASAVGEYSAAKAQLDVFRDDIVPGAQRAFDQTGEGYKAGRASFLDLLDAQRTVTEARVTLLELASSVTVARAKVIQIVGPDGLRQPQPAVQSQPVSTHSSERPSGAEVQP